MADYYQTTTTNNLDECKSIIESFVMDNDELENLEERLSEFNLFEAIGAVRRELRHSDFLGFILNPSESHNIGDYLLKLLLKSIINIQRLNKPSVIDIDVAEMHDVEILREWKNIDIIILSNENKFILAIENKIDTGEHSDQLNRYQTIVSEKYPNFQKLFAFLTPAGDNTDNDLWAPISYSLIHDIISKTVKAKKTTIGSDVLTLLQHYCTMLRRHIMTENEIASLCQKIYKKHRKALDLIFEHRPDMLSEIKDYLENTINKSTELVLAKSSKTYINFVPKKWDSFKDLIVIDETNTTNRLLLFEFNNRRNGLTLSLIVGPGSDDVRQKLINLSEKYPNTFKRNRKTPGKIYAKIFKINFLTEKDLEDLETEKLFEKIDRRWTKFLSTELIEIVDAISL